MSQSYMICKMLGMERLLSPRSRITQALVNRPVSQLNHTPTLTYLLTYLPPIHITTRL
jgi:hypothetical protein